MKLKTLRQSAGKGSLELLAKKKLKRLRGIGQISDQLLLFLFFFNILKMFPAKGGR